VCNHVCIRTAYNVARKHCRENLEEEMRQALRRSLGNHIVSAEGNKFDDHSKGKFTGVVSANIDVSGVLSADWISGHGDSRQTVFIA
jgi:hypothetical protein